MNVFISWSGNRSKAVAEILRDWIKCVIQATRPWISTRDIDRGALWFSEINDQLKDTSVGIVCLTLENKSRPWILFEAGALAKGLSTSRVCTLLIDLEPKDLEDPLAQLNHTLPTKESMLSLIRTLNKCLGTAGLDERILAEIFDTYWGQFKEKFELAVNKNQPTVEVQPRSDQNLLAEILENTRGLNQRLRRLESETDLIRSRTLMPKMADVSIRNEISKSMKAGTSLDQIIADMAFLYDSPDEETRAIIADIRMDQIKDLNRAL